MEAVGMRTGERMVHAGLITPQELEPLLKEAAESGRPVGEILAASTAIAPQKLYQELAGQLQMTYVNLQENRPQFDLLYQHDLPFYIAHNAIPLKRGPNRLILATASPSPQLQRRAEAKFACDVTLVIASPRDIIASLDARFGNHLLQDSCFALYNASPRLSAYQSLPVRLGLYCLIALLSLSVAILLSPPLMLTWLLGGVNILYLLSISFKWLLFFSYRRYRPRQEPLPATHHLPVYTVLIPLYDEASSVPGLLQAMRRMDYPRHLLDVKLILEEGDDATLQAIIAQKPENYFDIIRVPEALPQTKPKACNYALHYARGHYVTIYDAEDRPDPQQLRKAVATFRLLPDDTVCLQARLNYYNWHENLLTRWFAIEYASLFDLLLPGLSRLGLPVPLGGTSNHFHLKRLRELGEWDPFNVTEDADLGIRLAARNYRTALLPSVTLEEAPVTLHIWLKQRSRWIKGYIQTWLVHMRKSNQTAKHLGTRGFIGLQLFVGLPAFLFLLAPFFWGLFLLSLTGLSGLHFPDWISHSCLLVLVLGLLNHWFFALWVTRQWQWHEMGLAILTYPLYWFLHIRASFTALYQLIVKPYYWEKTPHGLSKYRS
jgi:cellulose synthase/poly-beta-1,6-N-acetylglucosamine synthase-like glycosyltransferase